MFIRGDEAVIGVDHGYGNIKTACCVFPTGITAHDKKPYFTENLLIYEGRYYTVGHGHKEYRNLKVSDNDYYLMTLAAIGRELAIQHRTSAKVLLAAGLPLSWVMDQQEAFKAYLMQKKSVQFTFRGTDFSVEFIGAEIYPQSFAAVASRLHEFKGVNMIADIGNGTVNLLRVIDRKPDPTTMVTEACGVKDCAIAMRLALANEHAGAKVDDSIIERIIRKGTAEIDSEYLNPLVNAARVYTDGLFRRMREDGYDPRTMKLYVMGGGSCLIQNFGDFDPSRVTFNNDIHANAKGYEALAAMSHK